MEIHASRRQALCRLVEADAYVAVNPEHADPVTLRYLTGFTGEGALVVTPEHTLLLTDSRYTEQASLETQGVTIEEGRAWIVPGLKEAAVRLGLRRVAFPASRVTYDWVEKMRAASDIEWVSERDLVGELRTIKTDEEIDSLRRAAAIADSALEQLVPEIRAGMSEVEVALRLEILVREHEGSDGLGFPINASAGPNTALNHYDPILGRRNLQDGDLLLFDFGACCGGYRSDITRTFAVGHADDRAQEIYDIVLRANRAAIDAVRSGVIGSQVDRVARDLIAGAGHAEHFGHGLGHGIGLEVHEAPSLSAKSEVVLAPGMVATIEPGIYLAGFGGVRIEDDVVVTESGCELLTSFPKDRLTVVG